MHDLPVPDGATHESDGGLFYRYDEAGFWFYNHNKKGWILTNSRPFLRPLGGMKVEDYFEISPETEVVPSKYADRLEDHLLESLIIMHKLRGYDTDRATMEAQRDMFRICGEAQEGTIQ